MAQMECHECKHENNDFSSFEGRQKQQGTRGGANMCGREPLCLKLRGMNDGFDSAVPEFTLSGTLLALGVEQGKQMMESQDRSLSRPHWYVEDIPYGTIEPNQADTSPELFYLLASASFVEITSDLYARNLVKYLHDDPELSDWLERQWRYEETQHGIALRCYVNIVWPKFDWDRAYFRFYTEYSRRCEAKRLGPTPALEMVSRCLVETGTATLYAMLNRLCSEPVLRTITAHIASDEVRHYKHFYLYFLRYQKQEGFGRLAVLRALCKRILEVNDEDAYCAFKHVFLECHPRGRFHDSDYRVFCSRWRLLSQSYYPYEMAAKMFLKPIGLKQWVQKTAVPLLLAGVKYLS
jgi:hypothetical protein